jgi:hypothetical protein
MLRRTIVVRSGSHPEMLMMSISLPVFPATADTREEMATCQGMPKNDSRQLAIKLTFLYQLRDRQIPMLDSRYWRFGMQEPRPKTEIPEYRADWHV